MGSFGSPWIIDPIAYQCYGCARIFAERRPVPMPEYPLWIFDTGLCAKCAFERKNPYRCSIEFRGGGETIHPFECPLLDCVQFIYETDCLLGVSNEFSYNPWAGIKPLHNSPVAELDFAACAKNPFDGR